MALPILTGPEDAAPDERSLKRDLVFACRILAANGQGDSVFGHVTARLPGWERCWMKPAGIGMEEVHEDDLVLLDFEGDVLAGTRPRHSEWPIHTEVMRARPEVLAVVHTHPLVSCAFAARGLALRPVSHDASFFWPPGVPIFDEFTELARTRAQGERIARALGERRGLFLLSHGIAVPGTTVTEATCAALLLDRAAQAQLLAQPASDTPIRHTPSDEADRKRAQIWRPGIFRSIFEYHVRALDRVTEER